jgi:uncharacterized protein with PQ loop repeat
MLLIPYSSEYAIFMIPFSAATNLTGLFQCHAIYMSGDAEGVSSMAWWFNLLSNLSWVVYGFMLEDIALLVSSFIGLVGSTLVLIVIQIYWKDSLYNTFILHEYVQLERMRCCK